MGGGLWVDEWVAASVKKESWSWRMEGNGRLGPSDSDPASPVSRGEIGECGCLGIGQW